MWDLVVNFTVIDSMPLNRYLILLSLKLLLVALE